MSLPLLATKLNPPPANPRLVRRERLIARLAEALQSNQRLTLICAPAGYGKTTLVSQWIQQQEERKPTGSKPALHVVWLSLDPGDNDLARFTAYLVAALQQIRGNLGQGTLAALGAPRPPAPQVLATLLINDLTALSEQVVLILDDYHHLSAQPIHDFMSYLIDHQPPQTHLVILSRLDPPLPLARLRARSQLTEIRQHDLVLTGAEIREFFERCMALELSPAQLQALGSRTEGWAAGLQLAALSLRNTENMAAFIQEFSGGHEYIADYLTGEVLEQQDEATRSFLLQTSILEQLSAPLCAAVSGEDRTAQTLEHLIRSNLFLIPLDHHGEWYRYHALFADLLRKRLQQSRGDLILELHKRAGRWYAQNQMRDQAIEHFLAGQDYIEAALLIEENAERILMHGQTATFLRWLEAFPREQMYAHPVLVVYQGLALILLGKIPNEALSLLQEIASTAEEFQGEADTLHAFTALMKGQAVEAIRRSEGALQRLPAERLFLRILAADSLAMAHTLRGEISSAVPAFERVVETAQQAGNVMMVIMGLSNLAGLHYQQGKLNQAYEAYQQVLEISTERLGRRSHAVGKALLGLGELNREWNDLPQAQAYFQEAAEMFRAFIDLGLPMAYLSLARVHLEQAEWDTAQACLENARQHAQASKTTAIDDSLVELMQARLWIAQGELEKVEQWARRRGLFDKPVGDLTALAERSATAFEVLQGEYLAQVHLLIAEKEAQKALDILATLLTYNDKRGQMRRVIEVLVLQAIAFQQMGETEEALQTFSQALDLAEPEGYVRTFLDAGQPVAQLLYQTIAADHKPSYARKLLAEFTRQASPPAPQDRPSADDRLLEPLSEREREVLGLIAEGLTNQEIGGRLHISLSTVKGHTAHIYGKLGVNNRTQAVAMGQSLGLLSRAPGMNTSLATK